MAWRAEPRTICGSQPRYSALSIATGLALRTVIRLALRRAERLVGSIVALLGLDLAILDHSTLSRRGETLSIPRPMPGDASIHLLVDSTGLRLCGPGEWLVEIHGSKRRRVWRKVHIGVNGDSGQIVAATLTTSDVDGASQVGPPLVQVASPILSFTGDDAYDRDDVYDADRDRHPDAVVIMPPQSSAVPRAAADTNPTQRDRHLHRIAARGRGWTGWQRSLGYNYRALVEADMGRFQRVIGDALRSRTDARHATELATAVHALNRMLELGQPEYVRLVRLSNRRASSRPTRDPCNKVNWRQSMVVQHSIARFFGALSCRMLAGFALIILFTASRSSWAVTPTMSTEQFTHSFGVNTHIDQELPAYVDGIKILNALKYLGWKDIRDGDTVKPLVLGPLVAEGVRIAVSGSTSPVNTVRAAIAIASLGPNALRFIEGPNEPNNWPITYNAVTSSISGTFLPVAQHQADLYKLVKATAAISRTPVLAVTSGGAEPDNVGLQFLEIPADVRTRMPEGTKFADLANVHCYARNGLQAVTASGNILADELSVQYGRTWARGYVGYSAMHLASLPRVLSEFGFSTTGPKTGRNAIDEATAAKHGLNMMFDVVQQGYLMSYIYELADDITQTGDEGTFGLFHADYTPKPLAIGIHNLQAIFANSTAGADTGTNSLDYTISNMPSTGHSMLLAKTAGVLDIVIWNEAEDWDAHAKRVMPIKPTRIAVQLGGTYAQVEVFSPLRGSAPVQSFANEDTVTVLLGDSPLIVRVKHGTPASVIDQAVD